MNNNTFEVLADGSEEGELLGVDSFKFTGLVPDAKVSIQDKSFNKADYPSTVSLLACSGKYGYFVAGHVEGFVFGQTQALRAAVYATEKSSTSALKEKTIVPLASSVQQIRLSSDESTILVATADQSLLSYSVIDLLEQEGKSQPKYSVTLDAPIIDLRPNTEAFPDVACILLKDHQCRIINWKSGETVATIPGSDFSAICWSPKGKQVACGRLDGTLEHYDLSGVKKDTLNSPESMQAGYGDENVNRNVQDVLWIENHQFLVLYSRPTEAGDDEFVNDGYIIDRKPKTGTGPKYIHLAEVTPIFSPEGRSNHFYMETIRGFGPQFPHVVILANGATNEVSVVGEDDQGNWATWDLPENGMASLPLSEETNCDTFPLGLALDYSACEKLPPYDPSESEVGVEPVPVLFHLNDEGHIGSYHCYNDLLASSGATYQGMKTAITPAAATIAESATAVQTPPAPATTPSAPTTSAFDPNPNPASALSTSSFSSSPFGMALGSGSSSTSSFASLTKVQGATTPTFGGAQGFGSSPGFGSLAQNKVPNAVTPTFGSTTGFGAAGAAASGASTGFGLSTSATPAFGSTTSFGSMAKKDNAPVFGSTTSFGSAATPTFGSTISFGSTANKTTTSAFGSTTSTSGGSAFGSATATTTDKKQAVPAFGSTPSFGATAKEGGGAPSTLPFGSTSFVSNTTTTATEESSNNDTTTTPKSGSTSSFEMVTKSDTNLDNNNNEKETDVEQQSGDAEKNTATTDVPSFEVLTIGEEDKQSETPAAESKEDTTSKSLSFDSLAIKDQDEQQVPATESKKDAANEKDDENEEKVVGDKLGEENSYGSDELADEKVANDEKEPTKATESTAAATAASKKYGDDVDTNTKEPVPESVPSATADTPATTTAAPSGFAALAAKKTISEETTTPTFGSTTAFGASSTSTTSTTTGGSGFGFSTLAKNTVPGAKAPVFGSTTNFGSATTGLGGFGDLAKKTVPGAQAPAFGSTSTLGGGSSFGSLAKKTVPGAMTPSFGSTPSAFGTAANNNNTGTFGSTPRTLASNTTEKPAATAITTPTTTTTTSSPAAIKPVTVSSTSSPAKGPDTSSSIAPAITQPTPLKYATPKESVKEEEKPAPKPEPKKEEGMAKQFEALYFKITADLEKLSSLQDSFEKQLQSQNQQLTAVNKTVQDLTGNLNEWRLGECGQLANIVETITNELKESNTSDQKEQIAKMELKTSELMNRKNQIEECLNTEEDPDMLSRLADRDLDDTTREDCESLELRCKHTGELLGELEYRIINKTKQQRKPAQADTSNFSFYDFHCAIRDVERDLKRKDAEMKDLEQKLQHLKFREHQRMAEQSPSAITFEDLTDDEYADALSTQTSPERNNSLGGHYTEQHIDYTVKYLQDEQVMDKLCTWTSQQPPCSTDADPSQK